MGKVGATGGIAGKGKMGLCIHALKRLRGKRKEKPLPDYWSDKRRKRKAML